MSSNGRPPVRRATRRPVPRTAALAVGAVVALVLVAVLVAPVVLSSGGGSGGTCTKTLRFRGGSYAARPAAGAVEAIAIGVGVASGCGSPPANVDVRSLTGVRPTAAVGLSGQSASIYVRRGVCAAAAGDALLACLRRSG